MIHVLGLKWSPLSLVIDIQLCSNSATRLVRDLNFLSRQLYRRRRRRRRRSRKNQKAQNQKKKKTEKKTVTKEATL